MKDPCIRWPCEYGKLSAIAGAGFYHRGDSEFPFPRASIDVFVFPRVNEDQRAAAFVW
jgi:hypothetical protein